MKSLTVLTMLFTLSAYPLAHADEDTRSTVDTSRDASTSATQNDLDQHGGGGGGHGPAGGGGHGPTGGGGHGPTGGGGHGPMGGGGHGPAGGGGHGPTGGGGHGPTGGGGHGPTGGGGHGPTGGGGHGTTGGGGHGPTGGGGHGPGGFHGGQGPHGSPGDHDHIHGQGMSHQWHYNPNFQWHYNPGWYYSQWAWPFGIAWASVTDVTCEAINSAGQVFVASGVASTWGGVWNSNVVGQQVLEEALDECQTGSGNLGSTCAPNFSDGFYNGCFLN